MNAPAQRAASEVPDLDYLRTTQLYRPAARTPGPAQTGGGWAPAIEALLTAGYSFLAERFSGDGCLFRGMPCGFTEGQARGVFAYFSSEDELARVERAMGIFFLSHEVSDALSVSRVETRAQDACVLAIPARVFNERLDAGCAGVLAIGDGGLVFRYPFIADPLEPSDLTCVLVHDCQAPTTTEIPVLRIAAPSRGLPAADLAVLCRANGLHPARPLPSRRVPVATG